MTGPLRLQGRALTVKGPFDFLCFRSTVAERPLPTLSESAAHRLAVNRTLVALPLEAVSEHPTMLVTAMRSTATSADGTRERQRDDGLLVGAAWSAIRSASRVAFAMGRRFERFYGPDGLYLQVAGGILCGYLPPCRKKVPLNYRVFSPGLVLGMGWKLAPALSVQANLPGNSALVFQLSAELDQAELSSATPAPAATVDLVGSTESARSRQLDSRIEAAAEGCGSYERRHRRLVNDRRGMPDACRGASGGVVARAR